MLVIGCLQLVVAGFVASRSRRLAEDARAAGREGRLHDLARRRATWLVMAAVVGLIGALNVLAAT